MKVCPGEDGVRHFDERIGVTMRILGMLLGTVLLAGCSTSTPSLDETDQVPKERLQVVHVQNGQTTHYRITVDSGLNIGLVPG